MKKTLFICGLILISINTFCQVWVDEGAVWHYDYSNIGYGGFYKYEYTGDTLIEGNDCQIITSTDYKFSSNQDGEIILLGQNNLGNQYTYTSGDTVFFWNEYENKFFTLFNFGAQVGDSWVIATEKPNNYVIDPNTDNDTSKIEVTDIGTMNINSNSYRYIKIKPVYGSVYGFEGTYIERFGNIDSTLAPFQSQFPSLYDYTHNLMAEWNRYKVKCFQDNSFSLYNPTDEADCEFHLTHLGLEENDLNNVECYPNPTTEQLTIKNPYNEHISIDIYDVKGKLLEGFHIHPISDRKLDVSNYENGLYFAKIGSKSTKGKIIKIVKK